MKNVIKALAREVWELRATIELAEKNGINYSLGRERLESTRQMLAMLIRGEM